jgi:hypothetical protein
VDIPAKASAKKYWAFSSGSFYEKSVVVGDEGRGWKGRGKGEGGIGGRGRGRGRGKEKGEDKPVQ